jgi:hypothetical protein
MTNALPGLVRRRRRRRRRRGSTCSIIQKK